MDETERNKPNQLTEEDISRVCIYEIGRRLAYYVNLARYHIVCVCLWRYNYEQV